MLDSDLACHSRTTSPSLRCPDQVQAQSCPTPDPRRLLEELGQPRNEEDYMFADEKAEGHRSVATKMARNSLIVHLKVRVADHELKSGRYASTPHRPRFCKVADGFPGHRNAGPVIEYAVAAFESSPVGQTHPHGEKEGMSISDNNHNKNSRGRPRGRPRQSDGWALGYRGSTSRASRQNAARRRPTRPRRSKQTRGKPQSQPPFHETSHHVSQGDVPPLLDQPVVFRFEDFEPPTRFGFPMRVEHITGQDGRIQQVIAGSFTEVLSEREYPLLSSLRPPFSPIVPGRDEARVAGAHFAEIPQSSGKDQFETILQENIMPNTPEFWMDRFLAQQAFDSNDLDFKMMCLNLIQAHGNAIIPKMTVENPLAKQSVYFFGRRLCLVPRGGSLEHCQVGDNPGISSIEGDHIHDNNPQTQHNPLKQEFPGGGTEEVQGDDFLPPYGVGSRKDPDNPDMLLTDTDWDLVLASATIAADDMSLQRRWRIDGKADEAEWAVCECEMRRRSRGSFVDDDYDDNEQSRDKRLRSDDHDDHDNNSHRRGRWVIREAGDNGQILKELPNLGYRRGRGQGGQYRPQTQ